MILLNSSVPGGLALEKLTSRRSLELLPDSN